MKVESAYCIFLYFFSINNYHNNDTHKGKSIIALFSLSASNSFSCWFDLMRKYSLVGCFGSLTKCLLNCLCCVFDFVLEYSLMVWAEFVFLVLLDLFSLLFLRRNSKM
ncbi:hypothetical protein Scep_019514 [Stephania cephalantha]|uniref:Uncharacterized protein n=1 Tax=Stephania cephalantha TaxID=152367 RepID=A0AAP0IB17_9MAGN